MNAVDIAASGGVDSAVPKNQGCGGRAQRKSIGGPGAGNDLVAIHVSAKTISRDYESDTIPGVGSDGSTGSDGHSANLVARSNHEVRCWGHKPAICLKQGAKCRV